MQINQITFMDGVAINKAHPGSFFIPSDDDKQAVALGDFVKIGSVFPDGGERFWVMVLKIKENGIIVAAVANHLTTQHLEFDDVVEFEFKHILAT